MAKKDNIRGVEKIEFGPCGNGVVGTSLTSFTAVVVNSLTLTGSEASEETIPTEQDDSYLTLNSGSTPAKGSVKLYEVTGDAAVMLLGGSYDATKKEWSAPKTAPNTFLSVVITTEEVNGQKAKITFPYAKIKAKHSGNVTKKELLSVEVEFTANTPVTSTGVEGAPYTIKWL